MAGVVYVWVMGVPLQCVNRASCWGLGLDYRSCVGGAGGGTITLGVNDFFASDFDDWVNPTSDLDCPGAAVAVVAPMQTTNYGVKVAAFGGLIAAVAVRSIGRSPTVGGFGSGFGFGLGGVSGEGGQSQLPARQGQGGSENQNSP